MEALSGALLSLRVRRGQVLLPHRPLEPDQPSVSPSIFSQLHPIPPVLFSPFLSLIFIFSHHPSPFGSFWFASSASKRFLTLSEADKSTLRMALMKWPETLLETPNIKSLLKNKYAQV